MAACQACVACDTSGASPQYELVTVQIRDADHEDLKAGQDTLSCAKRRGLRTSTVFERRAKHACWPLTEQ